MTKAVAMDAPKGTTTIDQIAGRKIPVWVIGGGFSGTAAAIQLLRTLPPDVPVVLCERGPQMAAGLAYATDTSGHLLNVRASNMSAFASEPSHFSKWLEAQTPSAAEDIRQTDAGVFVSRRLYRGYLSAILREAIDSSENRDRLRIYRDEVIDCSPIQDGYEILTGSGHRYPASAIILATGHVPPPSARHAQIVTDPWSRAASDGLAPEKPVLVLGTGLTMIDIVVALREQGFPGPVIAVSRGGLLPHPHRPTQSWPTPELSRIGRQSVADVVQLLRREVRAAHRQNIDWRAVVDSIRPVTANIWHGWSESERRRFLRHARRWWDVHRHRMAPPTESLILDQLSRGKLLVLAGHVMGMRPDASSLRVDYRPKGQRAMQSVHVQRVIVATGMASVKHTKDRLIRRLLESGIARLDPLGLGLDVGPDLQVRGADGEIRPMMWALGPIVRGIFWECTAVPDIRRQSERLGAVISTAFVEQKQAVGSHSRTESAVIH